MKKAEKNEKHEPEKTCKSDNGRGWDVETRLVRERSQKRCIIFSEIILTIH